LDAIKLHLDRRVGELVGAWEGAGQRIELKEQGEAKASYEVSVRLGFSDLGETQYNVIIDNESSVQDILDKIFYMLSPRVESFMYLQRWILREKNSGLRLVIREVADLVPASAIFRTGTSWEVVPLEKPYEIGDSGDPKQWYRRPLFESK
jgi:hypothetical protein